MKSNSDVLVVGAGIAGMQTSLLLAEQGHQVFLMDTAPAIGGFFPLLDRTFPTNYCGRCFMSPKAPSYCPIYENEFHENIVLLTNTGVDSLTGSAGDFRVRYTRRPRFVDPTKCNLCMKCTAVCPVEVDQELGGGLEKRKAIHFPFMQAIPRSFVIDETNCTKCGKCVDVCEPEAICLGEEPATAEISVGAIVLGFGFEPIPPHVKGEYGFGRYANVLSSIQFERMISTSGPTGGVPVRLSDGKPVKKIAFIQCVGSRDRSAGAEYCSSVCCRISTKQAVVAKERVSDLDASVYYMDIRAMGKEYESYFESARDDYGIRYLRSAVSTVRELQQSKDLVLTSGTDNGELHDETYDAVILSQGFAPPSSVRETAARLGIGLNAYGFCESLEFAPNQTTVPGIFAAGAFREPKDIPESVVDACSAAADVAVLLGSPEGTDEGLAEETDRELETPALDDSGLRLGIFICDRHDLLRKGVNIIELVGELSLDKDIVIVRWVDFTQIQSGLDEVRDLIEEREVNRVIIAGYRCLEIHKFIRKNTGILGTYSNLFSLANIGEQCASVHVTDRDASTLKALGLIRAAKESIRSVKPKKKGWKSVERTALVVGGGVSGMTAAVDLADQGVAVCLVERSRDLGGIAREARYTIKGGEIQSFLGDLIERVEKHSLIEIHRETVLEHLEGTWGQFSSILSHGNGGNGNTGKRDTVKHSAVVFAVGGKEIEPEGYLYGESPRVVTQRELEKKLHEGDPGLSSATSVAMVQCVNCRNEKHPYCSRVCCIHAIKNSLKLLEMNPDLKIYVFYRDIRTYGFYEKYYYEARDKGVIFVRYEPGDEPAAKAVPDGVEVVFSDALVGRELTFRADYLVLSVGIVPDNDEIAAAAGLALNKDGFFAEANPKSAPLDSIDRGKFFSGICHSPNLIENVICQGKAAAARAAVLIWDSESEFADFQAVVNERTCSGCGICIAACPYTARVLDSRTRKAVVLEDLCKGCGTCAVACPNGATRQDHFEQPAIIRMIDTVLQ